MERHILWCIHMKYVSLLSRCRLEALQGPASGVGQRRAGASAPRQPRAFEDRVLFGFTRVIIYKFIGHRRIDKRIYRLYGVVLNAPEWCEDDSSSKRVLQGFYTIKNLGLTRVQGPGLGLRPWQVWKVHTVTYKNKDDWTPARRKPCSQQ